ncbi:hypothetical protein SCHIN_v1c01150 [Spiroplasma chinense]|uniref:Protein-export membrane protein SecG n=1 Tax=Spiroplasma chinense TaxID=216932 RepID=A0A5B9Y3H6_9MOLU|nr:hypothetical protein [Spiroplasma chinense]QEH61313.1 hypothetical protein SCHIN_v1c01150 [Spiroplasma chinense]
MNKEQYILLGAAITFTVIALGLVILLISIKRKGGSSSTITLKETNKGGLAGIWSFTKRNILPFAITFCAVMAFTCVAFMFGF